MKPSVLASLLACLALVACGGSSGTSLSGSGAGSHEPLPDPADGPVAGNPDGTYPVPVEARAEDVSEPDHVIGTGTP